MRAFALVLCVAALVAACITGSSAASPSASAISLSKININLAHPNVIQFSVDNAKGHDLKLTFGGPGVKPVHESIGYDHFKVDKEGVNGNFSRILWDFVPKSQHTLIKITFPVATGTVGHGTCYSVGLPIIDGKPSTVQVRLHCVNMQGVDTNV